MRIYIIIEVFKALGSPKILDSETGVIDGVRED
jgi:hypothetical protein